jgi:hypothetical protein
MGLFPHYIDKDSSWHASTLTLSNPQEHDIITHSTQYKAVDVIKLIPY